MTPTTLAETILRDVPQRSANEVEDVSGLHWSFDEKVWLHKDEVLAALTAAMDPAIAEKAGEVLDSLAVLADMADLFSAPLLDDDDKPEMTVALERIVAAVPALLAQNAALRAERDDWQASQHYSYIGKDGKPVLARDLEDRAEAAEAQIAALTARVERLTGALVAIDAMDPEDKINGFSESALRGTILHMGGIARAALSTTDAAQAQISEIHQKDGSPA